MQKSLKKNANKSFKIPKYKYNHCYHFLYLIPGIPHTYVEKTGMLRRKGICQNNFRTVQYLNKMFLI